MWSCECTAGLIIHQSCYVVMYHLATICQHVVYALTWSPLSMPHCADKWKFCPYRGPGPVKASEGIIERPICPMQILILPLNRPVAACFMGLFSSRHFERCSVHRPSFPRTASPLFSLSLSFTFSSERISKSGFRKQSTTRWGWDFKISSETGRTSFMTTTIAFCQCLLGVNIFRS